MKVNRILPLLLCAVILVITVVLSSLSKPKETAPASAEITEITAATADEPKQEENEMRGVWVTYMDLSTENESSQSEAAFREKFAHIAKVCARHSAYSFTRGSTPTA